MTPQAILLSLVLAAPAPPDGLVSPPSVGGAMLLDEGDPASAAGVFEGLWNHERDPAALVWAGLSRARAMDAAHAVAYLTEALALDLPAPLADAARAGLADARRSIVAVSIELRLHGASTVMLALRRVGSTAPTLHFPLSPQPGLHVLPVALDPGLWHIELRRGTHTVARTVAVGPDRRVIALAEPTPPAPPRPRTRSLRFAGLITGGNLAIVGAGIMGVADARVRQGLSFLNYLPECRAICRDDLTIAAGTRAAGAGLLGAGLGVAVGALGTYFPTPRGRRIAWTVDLAVGGALVSASFFGSRAGATFNRTNQPHTLGDSLSTPLDRHTAGAATLGLGLGLAASATLALLLDRSDTRRARLRAHVTPTGLTLSGQF